MIDIRDDIFKNISHKEITANIISDDAGIIAGSVSAKKEAEGLGLTIIKWLDDGAPVKNNDIIASFMGTPKQIAMAEEVLMGKMAKPSGIATASKKFVVACGDRPKIVSGSWKKMPIQLKDTIRTSVAIGGAAIRISNTPFVYLDKNYIKMLGGIIESLRSTENLDNKKRVVQIHGFFHDIASEALEAVENGADIIFVDTGNKDDVQKVIDILTDKNIRQNVKIVFSGGICFEDLDHLKTLDIDFLDVGRAIVDAPLLDMRMEIITR